MPSANLVILMGHVTRDPQLKHLPNQTAVCEFGMAMNRKFKGAGGEDREEVTFVDCAVFGKSAEVIQKYVTKGKPLYVQGRLKFDSWDDKNGGGKRSKLSVIVENFQFVGGRDSDEQSAPPQRQQASGPGANFKHPPRPQNPAPQDPFGDESHFAPEDVPF